VTLNDRTSPTAPLPPGAHVAVIGAGIVGVACALNLLRAGYKVTMIDRQGPGEGTSFGNASVISPESVVPTATPGILREVPRLLTDPLGPLAIRWQHLPKLTPWLLRFVAASRPERVEAISHALAAILERALEAHYELVDWAGGRDMIRKRGWLLVAENERNWQSFQKKLALQRRRGVELTVLTGTELRQYEPQLNPVFMAGVYYPKIAHVVENFRFVRLLAEAAQRHGADYRKAPVERLILESGRVTGVRLAGETLPCDAAVVAAGAWSKQLAKQVGAKIPLDTERGYHLTLPQPGVELRLPVCSLDCGFVATPLENGLRLAGTDELGGLKLPPNWKRAEVLLTNAKRWFDHLDERDAKRWMGFRPSLPDSLPVIGRAPRAANAVLAFGHGHLGLTMGPRTGELVTEILSGQAPSIDLAPYSPTRF